VVLATLPIAYIMEKIAEKVFGGVSGDVIGATNEVSRAIAFILLIGVLITI
jgi:cobalamin synthase